MKNAAHTKKVQTLLEKNYETLKQRVIELESTNVRITDLDFEKVKVIIDTLEKTKSDYISRFESIYLNKKGIEETGSNLSIKNMLSIVEYNLPSEEKIRLKVVHNFSSESEVFSLYERKTNIKHADDEKSDSFRKGLIWRVYYHQAVVEIDKKIIFLQSLINE